MKQIVFVEPNKVELRDSGEPDGGGSLVRTEVTLVSPGTELAILSGGESWAPLPFVPGYAAVGRDTRTGERFFTHGRHEEVTASDVVYVPVPDAISSAHAVFARIASVSITAIRVGSIELGDWVAVFGMGIVGNLAAQLARLSGARVIAVDTNAARLGVAEQCGIDHTVQADGHEIERIAEITAGRMCSSVIEATGITAVVETAIRGAGRNGELILLGTPRATHNARFVDFLRTIHIADTSVTVKGAHEWCYPVSRSPGQREKHSILGNTETILDLIARRELIIDPLISHEVPPAEAPTVYAGIRNDPESYLGVVIDWSGKEAHL